MVSGWDCEGEVQIKTIDWGSGRAHDLTRRRQTQMPFIHLQQDSTHVQTGQVYCAVSLTVSVFKQWSMCHATAVPALPALMPEAKACLINSK